MNDNIYMYSAVARSINARLLSIKFVHDKRYSRREIVLPITFRVVYLLYDSISLYHTIIRMKT